MRQGAPASWAVVVLIAAMAWLAAGTAAQEAPAPGAWVEGPLSDVGVPEGDGRHMRVPLTVTVPAKLAAAADLVASVDLDLPALLAAAGHPEPEDIPGFAIDAGSFVVIETDEAGVPLQNGARVPSASHELSRQGEGVYTLRWTMGAPLVFGGVASEPEAAKQRWFHLYFDANYNGERTPASFDPMALDPLRSDVGNTRGTRHYVPLYSLPGQQATEEPRSVRIVNVGPYPTEARVYEYGPRGDLPRSEPAVTLQLPAFGGVGTYVLGKNGALASSGGVLIEADGHIWAEAISGNAGASATTLSPQFLPAVGGGHVGRMFVYTTQVGQAHYIYCPADRLPAGASSCSIRIAINQPLDQQQPVNIDPNHFRINQVAANSVVVVEALRGHIAIQRVGAVNEGGGSLGFSNWPPLDRAGTGSVLMGYAAPADFIAFGAKQTATARVQALTGGDPVLETALRLRPGLLEDQAGWGTSWIRDWSRGELPGNGPVIIRETSGVGGLSVVPGPVTSQSAFSALVPLYSPDGGYTYDFVVPQTEEQELGGLVVFITRDDTRLDSSVDGRPSPVGTGVFRTHERLNLDGAGAWHLEADRPVVAAWLKRGTAPFSGPTLGAMAPLDVQAGQVEFSGYLFTVEGEDFVTAKPGAQVRFDIDIVNLARAVTGEGLPDQVRLAISSDDLPGAQLLPATVELQGRGKGKIGHTQVLVTVPDDVDTSAGSASLQLVATSVNNPDFEVRQPLTVRFETVRKVEVTADGVPVKVRREIVAGGQAAYNITITNRGTVADTYDVEFSAPPNDDWSMDVRPAFNTDVLNRTPRLEPGGSAHYLVSVAPSEPGGSPGDLRTVVQAISTSNSFVRGKVELRTVIDVDRGFAVSVTDPVRSVPPGGNTTFNVVLHNNADVNEEIIVDQVVGSLPASWPAARIEWVGVADLADINNTVRIDPRSNITLAVHRSVPDNAPPFQLGIDRLRLRSTFVQDSAGADVELSTVVKPLTGFQVVAPIDPIAVTPGTTESVDINLVAQGTVTQAIKVHASLLPATQQWKLLVDGVEAPWNVTLSPNTTRSLTLDIQVAGSTPAGPAELPLTFSVSGSPASVTTLRFQVASKAAASISSGELTVASGRPTQLPAVVANAGNVPLDLVVTPTGLPAGWQATSADVALAPGETGPARVTVSAPPGLRGSSAQVTLRVADEGGNFLTSSVWSVRVGSPMLEVDVERAIRLDSGALNYQVRMKNAGDAPVYDVAAELVSGTSVTERVELQQLLPEGQATASLVGDTKRQAILRVTASHLEEPIVIDLSGVPVDGSKDTPGLGMAASVAALGLLSLAGRHRASTSGRREAP